MLDRLLLPLFRSDRAPNTAPWCARNTTARTTAARVDPPPLDASLIKPIYAAEPSAPEVAGYRGLFGVPCIDAPALLNKP